MDPSVPWQFTYNRLAAGVQGAAVNSELHHHFAQAAAAGNNVLAAHNSAIPSTTSQLLLQAAHSNSLVGGSAAGAFNPSSFLAAPNVNYENVFSPLFQHGTPKPAHFNALNAQRLAQVALNKQVSDADNYSPHHQQLINAQNAGNSGSTYFDQTDRAVAAAASVALAWQNNNQLPSPFGVLPHENMVAGGSPNTTSSSTKSTAATTIATSTAYDGFNPNFASSNQHNNSHSNNAIQKSNRDPAPLTNSIKPESTSGPQTAPFYHNPYAHSPDGTMLSNYAANKQSVQSQQVQYRQTDNKEFSTAPTTTSVTKDYRATQLNIPRVNTTNTATVYNNPSTVVIKSEPCQRSPGLDQVPSGFIPPQEKSAHAQNIQTKAHTKIYAALNAQSDRRSVSNSNTTNNDQQLTPISFSMDPSGRLGYAGNNNSAVKLSQNYQSPQHQQQQHSSSSSSSASSTYRHHYLGADNNNGSSSEFQNNSRNKSNPNSGETNSINIGQQQNDAPRRLSPLQDNSQASPLGHASSPAYPMYNSPMRSISSPQEHHQHHQQQAPNQINNYKLYAPKSPLDTRSPSSQHGISYSSVIQRASDQGKMFNDAARYDRQTTTTQSNQPQQTCWDSGQQQEQLHQPANKFQANAYANNQQSVEMQQPSGSPHHPNLGSSQLPNPNRNFNTNTPTLQDLSNCRGTTEPPSLAKTTTTNQPTITVAARPGKTSAKVTGSRKRKTIEKPITKNLVAVSNHSTPTTISTVPPPQTAANEPGNYYENRVPPPAHIPQHAITSNGSTSFFEYERWNLPPPPNQASKVYPPTSGDPTQLSNTFNNPTNVPQNHPHSNSKPPYPIHHSQQQNPSAQYFPTQFPHSHDFVELSTVQSSASTTATSVAMNHESGYNSSATVLSNIPISLPQFAAVQSSEAKTCVPPPTTMTQQQQPQQQREDEKHPKVIVPNIEDELGFLSENDQSHSHSQPSNNHQFSNIVNNNTNRTSSSMVGPATNVTKPMEQPTYHIKPSGHSAGFMSSYLKFLQGERDTTSPPVTSRPGRRHGGNWSRAAATPINSTGNKQQQTKNGDISSASRNVTTPKERKRQAAADVNKSIAKATNVKKGRAMTSTNKEVSLVEPPPESNSIPSTQLTQPPQSALQSQQQQQTQQQLSPAQQHQHPPSQPIQQPHLQPQQQPQQQHPQSNQQLGNNHAPAQPNAANPTQHHMMHEQQQQQHAGHNQHIESQSQSQQTQQQQPPQQHLNMNQYQPPPPHLGPTPQAPPPTAQQPTHPQMMQQPMYYQQPEEGAFSYFDLHLRRQRW